MVVENGNAKAVSDLLRTFIEDSKKDRDALRREIKELAHDTDRKISDLARDTRDEIENLGRSVLEQFAELRKGQKPDPRLQAQWVGVLGALVVMAATLIGVALNSATAPLQIAGSELKEQVVEHKNLTGHAGALANHAKHSVNIIDLKEEIKNLRHEHIERTRDRWTKKDHERWAEQLERRLEQLEKGKLTNR